MYTIFFLILLQVIWTQSHLANYDCSKLLMGQYICPDPSKTHIDPKTQQFIGCSQKNIVKVWCIAVEGIKCTETGNNTFTIEVPCEWTNGYHLQTALLLSVFLGMFGVDRFYLGYPGIGLIKFCTLGGMFLGQLIDVVLIATQIVKPADGSAYIIPYYGAGVKITRSNNSTFRLPRTDW